MTRQKAEASLWSTYDSNSKQLSSNFHFEIIEARIVSSILKFLPNLICGEKVNRHAHTQLNRVGRIRWKIMNQFSSTYSSENFNGKRQNRSPATIKFREHGEVNKQKNYDTNIFSYIFFFRCMFGILLSCSSTSARNTPVPLLKPRPNNQIDKNKWFWLWLTSQHRRANAHI